MSASTTEAGTVISAQRVSWGLAKTWHRSRHRKMSPVHHLPVQPQRLWPAEREADPDGAGAHAARAHQGVLGTIWTTMFVEAKLGNGAGGGRS